MSMSQHQGDRLRCVTFMALKYIKGMKGFLQ